MVDFTNTRKYLNEMLEAYAKAYRDIQGIKDGNKNEKVC